MTAYDYNEKVWNPAMPLLFQWRWRLEDRSAPGCTGSSTTWRTLHPGRQHLLTRLGLRARHDPLAAARRSRRTFKQTSSSSSCSSTANAAFSAPGRRTPLTATR